jgi:hypothetical protein
MKTRTMIQSALAAFTLMAAPLARADEPRPATTEARWGGGFGGGNEVRAAKEPATVTNSWAAGWGGEKSPKVPGTLQHEPQARTYWAGGFGGERTAQESKVDMAANSRRK